MKTIYCTKENRIFESDITVWHDGKRYMLDCTDLNDIKAYPLRDIATLGESWSFIQEHHPNYNCDEIAWIDDLDCAIGKECDMEKIERITKVYGSDPEQWKRYREDIYCKVLSEAIWNYKQILSKK